jgi:hypothetical protein
MKMAKVFKDPVAVSRKKIKVLRKKIVKKVEKLKKRLFKK